MCPLFRIHRTEAEIKSMKHIDLQPAKTNEDGIVARKRGGDAVIFKLENQLT